MALWNESSISGDLILTAGGTITDSGTVTVSGATNVTTSVDNKSITLDTLAATGTVTVNTLGDSGDVTILNSIALALSGKVSGTLNAGGTSVTVSTLEGKNVNLDTDGTVTATGLKPMFFRYLLVRVLILVPKELIILLHRQPVETSPWSM